MDGESAEYYSPWGGAMNESSAHDSVVRPMLHTDLELVLAWRNHPDVRRHMYTQHEITLDEHLSWFERASNNSRKHPLIFESHGKPTGFVNFSELECGGVADWGFYASPDAPRGSGRLLGRMALEYGFTKFKLHKVCGQALGHNERSIRFHQTLGFQQEGVLRDQHFDGTQYHHVFCFGLLRNEWRFAA